MGAQNKEEKQMSMLSDLFRRWLVPAVVIATCAVNSSAFAQGCEIKIGTSGPMSGGAAAWGIAWKAGPEFIAALVNEKGGIDVGGKQCKVKVLSIDGLATTAGGAAAANYFASEGVHAVVGPVLSTEHSGFKGVAARNGIVNFTPTYALDALSPELPLAFKASQGPTTWSPVLIKAAVDRFKFKSVAVIGPNDQSGTDGSRALEKVYAAQGLKTFEEYYQRGTTNFAPLATRIISLNVDTVEIATMPPADQSNLFKQLVEAGWKGIIGSLGGGGEKPILEGTDGTKAVKGVYWLETMDTEQPGAQKLNAEYKRLMKVDAPINSLFLVSANATEIMLAAISKAGTAEDGEKIAKAMEDNQPASQFFGKEGWRGKAQFKINHELAFPVGLGIYEAGKRIGVTGNPIASE